MRNCLFLWGVILWIATGCSKTTKEDYGKQFPPYRSFLPISAGQLSFYRLDSTVIAPFGVALNIHSYFVKDSVGKADIAGSDTTFAVYRYLTDTLKQQPWAYSYTYRIILKDKSAESIDLQNRRFIMLVSPVKDGYSWDGNRYFSTEDDINSNDPYYGWTYTYDQNSGAAEDNSTLTIEQVDVTEGNQGNFDTSAYQKKKRAYETYKQQTGLVTKVISYITYQPNANNPKAFGSYTDDSFGFKLTRLMTAP